MQFRLASIPGADNFCIAFIVLAIGIVCTAGATAWQSRYPLPVSYVKAEPKTKDTARVETSLSIHLVPTTSYRLDPPAVKAEAARWTQMPWTCGEIRAYARTHTEAEMHAKAIEHRLTPQQRAIAKACLETRR